MKLSDLTAAVKTLLARADGAMKAEVEALQATVQGQLATLTEQLTAAQAANASLQDELNTTSAALANREHELAAAQPLLAEFTALNAALTDACLSGKLMDLPSDTPVEAQKAALLARPATEKFKAYQGALNAAFVRANVPAAALPSAPLREPGAPAPAGAMKRDAFLKLTPQEQLAAAKAGVRLTD